MKLYLDTEFNGHGGELISIAIASTDRRHWYGVLSLPEVIHPWVAEHVIPFLEMPGFLGECTIASPILPEDFRDSLLEYLDERRGATIYADWPDDFAHLMKLMSGPSYEKSWMVPCKMVLLDESDPKPAVPHNALSDAIALMRWHNEPRGLSAAEGPEGRRVDPSPPQTKVDPQSEAS